MSRVSMSRPAPAGSISENAGKFSEFQAANAETVLKAFNTWAYKRQRATEPELLFSVVERAVARMEPISFVLYWGKGPRSQIAQPEMQCMAFLKQMTGKVDAIYPPGSQTILILTDTHAALNGHSQETIDAYFGDIGEAARDFDFSCVRLSEVIASANSQFDAALEPPGDEMLSRLEASAAKWYKGEESVRAAAARYYQLNMIERQAVGIAYPHSVFVTFNNAHYRELFPHNLPVFYMYSLRKGNSVKPWFLDAEGKPVPGGWSQEGEGWPERPVSDVA